MSDGRRARAIAAGSSRASCRLICEISGTTPRRSWRVSTVAVPGQAVEALERHDERPPPVRVDAVRRASRPDVLVHVDAGDRCFEQERRVIPWLLAGERVRVDDTRFEVHRALVDPLSTDGVPGPPVQFCCGELVRDVPVADPFLAGRHRVASGRQRQGVHGGDDRGRGQVEDALAGCQEVPCGLGPAAHTEHRGVSEPEHRRHRCGVGDAVLVDGAQEHDGRAEVEDRGIDAGVLHGLLSVGTRTGRGHRRLSRSARTAAGGFRTSQSIGPASGCPDPAALPRWSHARLRGRRFRVLARSVVPLLLAAGHDVTVTSRSAEKARLLERPGVSTMVLDALDRDSTFTAIARAEPDAVLHLMTDLGTGDSASNARLRSTGTRNLVDAAQRAGVDRIVAQSISWVHPSGTDTATEVDPVDLDAGSPAGRPSPPYGRSRPPSRRSAPVSCCGSGSSTGPGPGTRPMAVSGRPLVLAGSPRRRP